MSALTRMAFNTHRQVDLLPGDRDDVRTGDQLAVFPGHGQGHNNHAVLGQVTAVPEDHTAHVAHAVAVYKDLSTSPATPARRS